MYALSQLRRGGPKPAHESAKRFIVCESLVLPSKRQSQRELDFSLRVDHCRDRACIGHTNDVIRETELRCIQEIERFGADFQADAFRDADSPGEAEIKVVESRSR